MEELMAKNIIIPLAKKRRTQMARKKFIAHKGDSRRGSLAFMGQ
jgi:hypothetical protein